MGANRTQDPEAPERGFRPDALLKADLFGRVERGHSIDGAGQPVPQVRRDIGAARWWARPLARRLAAREARVLRRLGDLDGLPRIARWDGRVLLRSWLDGEPMQIARPVDPAYFRDARRLLARMRRRGACHNDLAKEPNWLVLADGRPGLVDFQLARCGGRGRWLRMLAREDVRHLLKHKRTYCPEALTARELALLGRPSQPARIWRRTGKPVYLWITRGLFGWADREGAGDRGVPR